MNDQSPQTDTACDDGILAAEAGGVLTVDLAAVAANWSALRARSRGAETAAVVKADAYGTGIERTVPALHRAGCRTFFVAQLSEGFRARNVCPQATIYVLNGFIARTGSAYASRNLRPCLGSQPEIDEWAALCRSDGVRRPAALHVDTGMNRLGLSCREGLALKNDARLGDFEPALLMSHLVSAETPEDPLNARQIAAFNALRQALPDIPASLANSSGILLPQTPHFDLVRPGYALYGGNPTPGSRNPMLAAVRLEARVIQLRAIGDGDTAGYNGTWTARSARRLATLSVGYADGYPRAAGATDMTIEAGIASGEAIVAGRRCPFAGRVSMDLITLDVSALPDGAVARGDLVTLLGDDLTVDEVGRRAGTIGYEILTRLGRRYARRYLGGDLVMASRPAKDGPAVRHDDRTAVR